MHNHHSYVKMAIAAGLASQVAACAVSSPGTYGGDEFVSSPSYYLDHSSNYHHFMVE